MVDEPYRYKSIQPGQIRLLHLPPDSHHHDLSVSIEHKVLNEDTVYEALSYTWGTPVGDRPVRCETCTGTQRIAVTKNLEEALVRLRQSSHTRVLWIDQICINQCDIQERNAQVSRMGDIYASASRVVIWIGEEDERTKMAFDFLPVLLAHLPKSTQSSSREEQADDQYLLPAEALMIARSPGWEALEALFDRPWFERVWVIQETAMASFARIYCGSYSATWHDISKACRCQARNSSASRGQTAAESMDRIRQNHHADSGTTLLDALFMSYRFQCTDMRDKIFALAGLANHAERGMLPPSRYDLSIDEIYHRSAVAILRSHGNLDLLRCVIHPRPPSNLPSWVPDWRANSRVQRMLRNEALEPYGTRSTFGVDFSFSDDNSILIVQGRSIGTVLETSAEMSYLEQEDTLAKWRDLAQIASKNYFESYPRTFWETLVAAAEHEPCTDDATGREQSIAAMYLAWQKVIDRRSPQAIIQASSSITDDNEKAINFNGRMLESSIGRKMFIVDNAGIGLGPSEGCPGDLVCCFGRHVERTSVLCVVRPDGESFRFIGEAYVHSVSSRHGNLRESFNSPEQRFNLS